MADHDEPPGGVTLAEFYKKHFLEDKQVAELVAQLEGTKYASVPSWAREAPVGWQRVCEKNYLSPEKYRRGGRRLRQTYIRDEYGRRQPARETGPVGITWEHEAKERLKVRINELW